MQSEWHQASLRAAGVVLIDCDHRTPPAAEEGYPYVAIPQMNGGRIDFSGARRISHKHFIEWTRRARPREYDVVLSRRCNPGESAHVPEDVEFALGQNLVLLRADGSRIYPPFLRWLIRSRAWWEQVGRFINVGAVFDSLRCADIPEFELPIPPLSEQKAIARILGDLDDKIELNRQMNATLEAMAQALFKRWFVDFDDVGSEAWTETVVGDICSRIFSGGTPNTKTSEFWNGDLPWLSSGETRNRVIIETEKTITAAGVERSSTRLAPAGCTVIASAGQGHTRGQTSLLSFDSYINQSVVALVADPERASELFLYFNLARRYEELRQVSDSHSSRGSLTTKILASLPVLLPPRDRIAAFDQTVRPWIDRMTTNLRESRTLAALRDTLLPKLLSGELRVPEAGQLSTMRETVVGASF